MKMFDVTFAHREKRLFAVRAELDENHDEVFKRIDDENFIFVFCHDHENLHQSSIRTNVYKSIDHVI
jgi:hypothetical protein